MIGDGSLNRWQRYNTRRDDLFAACCWQQAHGQENECFHADALTSYPKQVKKVNQPSILCSQDVCQSQCALTWKLDQRSPMQYDVDITSIWTTHFVHNSERSEWKQRQQFPRLNFVLTGPLSHNLWLISGYSPVHSPVKPLVSWFESSLS